VGPSTSRPSAPAAERIVLRILGVSEVRKRLKVW
jgi:hypothetical protein